MLTEASALFTNGDATFMDKHYLSLCRQLIEKKFFSDQRDGILRQRDLEYLANRIEEQSGIKLSLSTLKRLWKKDYDQVPHPTTLDALVSLLGYKDWQEFKLKHTPLPQASPVVEVKKHKRPVNWWMAASILTGLFIAFWLISFRSNDVKKPSIKVNGPVTFTGNKTVAQGVPNTIIFNYDVSNIEADSFFFQQSWNDQEKVKIDPQGHHYSAIYYYPGFHRAKLIANDSIITRFRVHITTDGWMPLVRYSYTDSNPIYIKKNTPVVNGALHVTSDDLVASNVATVKDFVLSYFNVREFENTHSDNFSLSTRVSSNNSNATACPGFEVVIQCEAHIFFVRMMNKGCERDNAVKMGEVFHDGVNHDLSALGRDLRQWQDLRIDVVNKNATIYLDNTPVYTLAFKNDFGKIVGLVYNFAGTGMVDYVKVVDGENRLVYEEGFD